MRSKRNSFCQPAILYFNKPVVHPFFFGSYCIIDVNSIDIKVIKDKENELKVDGFTNNTLKISGKMQNGKTEELEQSIIHPELYLNNIICMVIYFILV